MRTSHEHLEQDVLNEYLDGALELPRRSAVAAHLEQCPACTARLSGLRQLFVALDTLPELDLDIDLAPRVVSRLPRRSRDRVSLRPALRPLLTVQFLVALLLLGATVPVLSRSPQVLAAATLIEQAAADGLARFPAHWLSQAMPVDTVVSAALRAVLGLAAVQVSWLGLGTRLAAVTLLWLVGNGLLLRGRWPQATAGFMRSDYE